VLHQQALKDFKVAQDHKASPALLVRLDSRAHKARRLKGAQDRKALLGQRASLALQAQLASRGRKELRQLVSKVQLDDKDLKV
jgi:hypothetical protein